jgi:8-oxo-dGTP diphosphatase
LFSNLATKSAEKTSWSSFGQVEAGDKKKAPIYRDFAESAYGLNVRGGRDRAYTRRVEKPDAVVAVVRREGQFLVIRRGPDVIGAGHWTPPSGRVEPGESQEDALRRELREELGLDVTPVGKVWECDSDDGTFRLHWWTARADSDELLPNAAEVSAVRWVTPTEFLEFEPTYTGDREFVLQVFPRLG